MNNECDNDICYGSFTCLLLFLSVSLCLYTCPIAYSSFCLLVSVFVYPSFVYLFSCLPVCLFVCLYACSSSAYLFICVTVSCLFVWIYQFTYIPVYLSANHLFSFVTSISQFVQWSICVHYQLTCKLFFYLSFFYLFLLSKTIRVYTLYITIILITI